MPRVLAEVTSAPQGTQYREDDQSQWQAASVGTKLYEDYEIQNTSGDYGVELDYEVEIEFDSLADVEFGTISGQAKYLDSTQTWQKASSNDQVEAYSVATGENSTVPISIEVEKGKVVERPW